MANLNVRRLDDTIYEQLRVRAAKHGVSMEEEARQIIIQAIDAPEKISDIFKKHFGIKKGVNLDKLLLSKPHKPMDFDK